jgi:hypothetical protein
MAVGALPSLSSRRSTRWARRLALGPAALLTKVPTTPCPVVAVECRSWLPAVGAADGC